jgi:hypothetical protein
MRRDNPNASATICKICGNDSGTLDHRRGTTKHPKGTKMGAVMLWSVRVYEG